MKWVIILLVGLGMVSVVSAATTIDADSSLQGTTQAYNENICHTDDYCFAVHHNSLNYLEVLRASYIAANQTCGDSWTSKQTWAGSWQHATITCTDSVVSVFGELSNFIRRKNSTDDGDTWGDGHIGLLSPKELDATVDDDGVNHICWIDSSSDLRHLSWVGSRTETEISSSDSDWCAITSCGGDEYIGVLDTSGDDIDVMSSKDSYSSRNEWKGNAGAVTTTDGETIDIDCNQGMLITASIHSDDLWECHTPVTDWTDADCGEIDSSTSLFPHVTISNANQSYILYATGTWGAANDVVLANSSTFSTYQADRTALISASGSWAPSSFAENNSLSFTGIQSGNDFFFEAISIKAPVGGGGPTDSCSPTSPLSADHTFDCSDECRNVNLNANGHNLFYTGTGTISGDIYGYGWEYISQTCWAIKEGI